MPVFGGDLHGDLYVEYKVVLPLELSSKMRRSKVSLYYSLFSRQILNPRPSGLDRVFNGDDYNGGRESGRDEL